MPVLPEPTTVYAVWGRLICGNWFRGTQRTPGATAYLGGWVDGTAVCAWVASTTFLRTVICRLLPLVSERTWCLPSGPMAYSDIANQRTRPEVRKRCCITWSK